MAYFPNGTSFEIWAEHNCKGCVHNPKNEDDEGCPILGAHLIHNYDECNKDDSILHMLIPLTKDGLGNEKCKMRFELPSDRCKETLDMFEGMDASAPTCADGSVPDGTHW